MAQHEDLSLLPRIHIKKCLVGTKSEPAAETLMQIIEVASHSLNEEFGRLINFLLITVDWRAGEKELLCAQHFVKYFT